MALATNHISHEEQQAQRHQAMMDKFTEVNKTIKLAMFVIIGVIVVGFVTFGAFVELRDWGTAPSILYTLPPAASAPATPSTN